MYRNRVLGQTLTCGRASLSTPQRCNNNAGPIPRRKPMLSDADRKMAADILMTAAKERKQAVQLSKTWPDITLEDSYAISTEVAKRKIAAGARLIGHKVGLTSKAMQRSSQIDEPDYGHLLDTMM